MEILSGGRLRILHTESSLGWGGQELRSVLEVRLLTKLGQQAVIAVSHKGQFAKRAALGPQEIKFGEISKKNLRGLFEAVRILKAFKPDVLVTHSSTDSWLFTIARWILGSECGLVRVRHVRANVISSMTTRWLYSRSQFVVTTSEDIRDHLISVLRLSPDKVISVPTGIDVARFSNRSDRFKIDNYEKLGVSRDKRVIVMLSTLRSWKGHETAIRAMLELDGHTLVIVGDGPREIHLRRMVDELKLSDRVVFAGFSFDAENILAIANVFLQPSLRHEGVSQSLLQAGAMKLPVVASDIGGLNEVIKDGVTGLLIQPGSVNDLVLAVRRFETDPQLAEDCGSTLLTLIHSKFSQEIMIDRMESIYRLASSQENHLAS